MNACVRPALLVGALAFLHCALLTGCVIGQNAVAAPSDEEQSTLLVGSAALGEPMASIARHPWIALKVPGETEWERWEVMCCPTEHSGTVRRSRIDPLSDHGGGGGDVRIHGIWRGKEADRMIACVRERAPKYPYDDEYLVWPGPNSNTFVDYMLRECDIAANLPAPSIGKDYRGLLVGVSTTSGGTGVQLETPAVGVKLGVTEGVELHVFGMAFGVDLWPPAFIVPIGPGRLGFEDR
jgi:hypothetical protein